MAAAAQTQSQIISKLLFQSLPAQSENCYGTPSSHDISSACCHVTQEALLLQLDHAVKASWTSRHQSKYADVKVLLLSWDSDDLGVEKEIHLLKSVFKDAYRYDDVEHWKIPDKKPGHEANARIAKFIGSGAPDNLLIIYYAGHSMASGNRRGLPVWFANRQPNSPKFNSSMIQEYACEVDDSSPDILFLYDTCHSANGHGSVESTRSTLALLAACGFESVAAETGPHSFTFALIQELSEAASLQKPISVPQLHSNLLNRLHLKRQDVLLQEKDGKLCIRTSKDGIPLFEYPVWRTPIYVQLSHNARARSIMLAPLPAKSRSLNDPEFITLNTQPASARPTSQPNKTRMHVLLRVSVAEDEFDIEAFKDWICDAPETAQQVKVITTLPSCSTLVLLQMPVEVWDMLPASPAMSFVGFVAVEPAAEPSGKSSIEAGPSNPLSGNRAETSINDIRSVVSPRTSGKRVAFRFNTDDERSTLALLDCVDSMLPTLFRQYRQTPVIDETPSETWVLERVRLELERISLLEASDFDTEAVSLSKNVKLVNDYVGARFLLEHDNPFLDLTGRLNPFFSWRNYDADIPDDQQTISTDLDSRISDGKWRGSVLSETKSDNTSLTSITNFSFAHRARLAGWDGVPTDARTESHTQANTIQKKTSTDDTTFDPDSSDVANTIEQSISPSGSQHANLNDQATQMRSPRPTSHDVQANITQLSAAAHLSADLQRQEWTQDVEHQDLPTHHSYGTEGEAYYSQQNMDFAIHDSSSSGADTARGQQDYHAPEDNDFFAPESCLQNRETMDISSVHASTNAGVVGEDAPLDLRYQVEPSYKFVPGKVFKVLWSEPTQPGLENPEKFTEAGSQRDERNRFYVGFRRFIILANDEGHCTCVPILTYQGQGCKKSGVEPSKHGIICNELKKPKLLRGEPKLGFRPVRMTITAAGEALAKESRVNYSKLVTVEHNVKVFFIGEVVEEDFEEIVRVAVDECWTHKLHRRQKQQPRVLD